MTSTIENLSKNITRDVIPFLSTKCSQPTYIYKICIVIILILIRRWSNGDGEENFDNEENPQNS